MHYRIQEVKGTTGNLLGVVWINFPDSSSALFYESEAYLSHTTKVAAEILPSFSTYCQRKNKKMQHNKYSDTESLSSVLL